MNTDAQIFSEHATRFAKIVEKKKKGVAFSANDRAFLTASQLQQHSYDSIASAAATLSVDVRLLRIAKKNGAPGFVGSRVYPAKLLPWLVQSLWDSSRIKSEESFKTLIDAEKHRRLKLANDEQSDKFYERADVDAWLIETIEKIKAKCGAKLINELPPKLEGLRAPEIAARLEPFLAELTGLLRSMRQ